MKKTYFPTSVKPLEDYNLSIVFNNGENRIFDMKPYFEDPYFAPAKLVFNSVKTNPLTIEWDGEIDICPDELYFNSVKA